MLIGSVPATDITVTSGKSITLTIPPAAVPNFGAQPISVVDPSGTVTGRQVTYTYDYPAAPFIGTIRPDSGSLAGGTVVKLSGRYLSSVTAVRFGNKPAAAVTVLNDNEITVTAPAGDTLGSYPVSATGPNGTSPQNPKFTYLPPTTPAPQISTVVPASGPSSGGYELTLKGTNLAGTSKVTIGGADVTGMIEYEAAGEIRVRVPQATTAGQVQVVVTTWAGSAGATFTYAGDPRAPYIAYVSPPLTGPAPSSAEVRGNNLDTATTVTVNGQSASFFYNGTSLVVNFPASATPAAGQIVVTNPNGTSPPAEFMYLPANPPTVTSVSPAQGTWRGGTTVTVTGTNFSPYNAVVKFGTSQGLNVQVQSPTQLTVTTPAAAAGPVPVLVSVNSRESAPGKTFTFAADVVPTYTKVAGSTDMMCGLTSSGTVYCWGGIDGARLATTPMAITGVTDLFGGGSQVCGLKSDKTLWCWGWQDVFLGRDYYGPAKVFDGASSVSVWGGFPSGCATKADGTVWCWTPGLAPAPVPAGVSTCLCKP